MFEIVFNDDAGFLHEVYNVKRSRQTLWNYSEHEWLDNKIAKRKAK